MARSGYTLPVFAVAAAKAALLHLHRPTESLQQVDVDLLSNAPAQIPIQQVARLDANSALAVTLSDPGDNLDLTRNTPIWAWVQQGPRQSQPFILEAGEGLGVTVAGEPAIYRFARQLFDANLLPLISGECTVTVSIILPEGRQLAQRTSNAAFGIVEGLALLGTSGIAQPLSAEDHLATLQQALRDKATTQLHLIFCIGSNGMQVAERLQLPSAAVVQTGNWIGALLLEAALQGVKSVLLLGYQGKLAKLAGGIFNTSSHLADAKLEIISAAVAEIGGDLAAVRTVLAAKTADDAYQQLKTLDLAKPTFQLLATRISQRATRYVQKYADAPLQIGTVVFDRKGQIIAQDDVGTELIHHHQTQT